MKACMKFIDTARDTRITHLLKRTDPYRDSLALAVMAQQREGQREENSFFETEDGPANLATSGDSIADDDVVHDKSQVDHYAVAHKLGERQPTILVGGNLKGHQSKGFRWMVGLCNNRLDGISGEEW